MTPQEGPDSLSRLEDGIQGTVQLVARLRKEKEAAQKEGAELRAQVDRLTEEVKSLQADRKQVRARIEKLLGQIDQLGNE